MGSHRSARRQGRAAELGARFGNRHPRLSLVIVSVVLAGVVAICAFQIRHGTYLGRGWLYASVVGMAAAAAFSAAALIRNLRHGPALGRLESAWTVLGVVSASSIRFPFPLGRYGSVQAFLNVVHAALLGYATVTCAGLIALFAFLAVRPGGLPGLAALRPPPEPAAGRHGLPDYAGQLPPRQRPRARGWPRWVLAGAVAALAAGFILAAVGGPHRHDAAITTAAGWLILLALAGMCVAGPAALYRRHRSTRGHRWSGSLPGTESAAQERAPRV